ncbi:hypothetical protein [Marinobacter sp.]|jgi:hypothetical protein|uniref:hypothetical protein n=1 Tax=Marinobacter sp. TaxID=50741 RepID=UPI000C51E584|nr:hypothetical protein [Marinobacter sp.]MAK49200.1 hypothetical protein [Marinobacter sp.]MAO28522.1 hypothetical protein [Roseovarius sp.]MTI77242.1 hypothetical protein [Marinobacter sp.]|tara:strand:- start:1678 stop:2310 length:633 start_codon:yes stop_codon:yes gene_type:complete
MKRDHSGWIVVFIAGAIVLSLHLVSSYSALFERRPAYLYEPKSNDVYLLELAPGLSPFIKWEIFNPFHKLNYIHPDGGEYLGKLNLVLEQARLDQELLEEDFDKWIKKQKASFRIGRKTAEGNVEIDYWDFEYFANFNKGSSTRLPANLHEILKNVENKEAEILQVDAVVVHRVYNLNKRELDKPPSIKVLRSAILLKGEAASRLMNEGL